MKQLLDFIPLIFFLIVYKMEERIINIFGYDYTFGGVFSATEVLVVSTILVFGAYFIKNRTLSKTQLITLVAVIVFCSFTIIFRSEAILKWKAPVVNWIFSGIFITSHFMGDKTAIEHMLGHAFSLPPEIWKKINLGWAGCFLFLGCANLYVAFTFHEIWVDFKVYGSLGILFLFNIAQVIYISPYLIDEEEEDADSATKEQEVDVEEA